MKVTRKTSEVISDLRGSVSRAQILRQRLRRETKSSPIHVTNRTAKRLKVTPETLELDLRVLEDYDKLSSDVQAVLCSKELVLTRVDLNDLTFLTSHHQRKVIEEATQEGKSLSVILRGEEVEIEVPRRRGSERGAEPQSDEFTACSKRIRAAVASLDSLMDKWPDSEIYKEAAGHFDALLNLVDRWRKQS